MHRLDEIRHRKEELSQKKLEVSRSIRVLIERHKELERKLQWLDKAEVEAYIETFGVTACAPKTENNKPKSRTQKAQEILSKMPKDQLTELLRAKGLL